MPRIEKNSYVLVVLFRCGHTMKLPLESREEGENMAKRWLDKVAHPSQLGADRIELFGALFSLSFIVGEVVSVGVVEV